MRHVVADSPTWSERTLKGRGDAGQATSYRAQFAGAPSLEDVTKVAAEAIIEKLAKLLVEMRDDADIDRNKQLQMYGVDSLLAVEPRNWIDKEFEADITVFEIQGASTLGTLSVAVAIKSQIRNERQGNAEAIGEVVVVTQDDRSTS